MTLPSGHHRADEWAAEEHTTAVREQRGCWHCWGIAQGIAAAKKGSIPAGFPKPSEVDGSPLPEGYVWLGALSGWEVGIMRHWDGSRSVCLYHRCGWAQPLRPCGVSSDHGVFLGNIVQTAVDIASGHECPPYVPSPEHQERVKQWQESSGRSPRPLPDAPRLVDGPGCTPAVVPQVDTGEPVAAGSLYANKCAECTTGLSCEDARTCLFEG